MTIFKVNQTVKRNDTGERVTVLDVIPNGHTVIYRVENEAGYTAMVIDVMLREVC